MSTNSTRVGDHLLRAGDGRQAWPSRGSGTATTPTLGSIVQKGKLAAWAWALATRALKRVDLPTLGSPTIPALSMGEIYPRRRTQFLPSDQEDWGHRCPPSHSCRHAPSRPPTQGGPAGGARQPCRSAPSLARSPLAGPSPALAGSRGHRAGAVAGGLWSSGRQRSTQAKALATYTVPSAAGQPAGGGARPPASSRPSAASMSAPKRQGLTDVKLFVEEGDLGGRWPADRPDGQRRLAAIASSELQRPWCVASPAADGPQPPVSWIATSCSTARRRSASMTTSGFATPTGSIAKPCGRPRTAWSNARSSRAN